MTETISYFLHIKNQDGTFVGQLRRGRFAPDMLLPELELGSDDQIKVKEQRLTLKRLLKNLIRADESFIDWFDERAQLDVGQYLYAQTFKQLPERPPTEGDVEVWVITEDEHVARLPWVLLARNSDFLCINGWSVSVTRGLEKATSCHELPRAPRMLAVLPELGGSAEVTRSRQHRAELEKTLAAVDPGLGQGRRLQIVRTFKELTQAARDQRPELIYFYGHGKGNPHTSRLIFAGDEVPVIDFAERLHEACGERSPSIVYVNCCGVDAGGALGAGQQLGKYFPAVIANRTVAFADTARQQAVEFWRAVLEGVAPHVAVTSLYRQIGDLDLSYSDCRWMTPICYRAYFDWKANPPKKNGWINDDPNWHLKIDRVSQFGGVFYQAGKMLDGQSPRSHVFVWYGQEDQDVVGFHDRLRLELKEIGKVYTVCPEWPTDFELRDRSFENMLEGAFGISFDGISSKIRARRRASRKKMLVYAHHKLEPREGIEDDVLNYIRWWDDVFNKKLKKASAVGLLGISYVTTSRDPAGSLFHYEKLAEKPLHLTGFKNLGEMKPLAKSDLWNFLIAQKCERRPEDLRRSVDDIMSETRGHYEKTVRALQREFCR